MAVDVATAVAEGLGRMNRTGKVDLIWHGGEPLAAGHSAFRELLAPFARVLPPDERMHSVQTNGTLLSLQWCRLFEQHQFNVGVSIDGPPWANRARRDLQGRAFFDRTLRGVACLRDLGVRFSVIAVVTSAAIDEVVERMDEYFGFFIELGCAVLGINIEEHEGINNQRAQPAGEGVNRFWTALFREWLKRPEIRVREFDRALAYISHVLGTGTGARGTEEQPVLIDLFPTVAWNGDVALLSPELAGIFAPHYGNFLAGNVLREPFDVIVSRAMERAYVREFFTGVAQCQQTCGYFGYCRGGQGSNKFFEHGTLSGTETTYCLNRKQRLMDSVLDVLKTTAEGISP